MITGIFIGLGIALVFWLSCATVRLGTIPGDYIRHGSNPPPPRGGYQPRPAPPPGPPPRNP